MATIALYASKINQMPGLVKDIKKSVIDYKSELSSLRTKSQQINQSICDLSDVISSIQASSQTQDKKISSLEMLNQNIEQFAETAARIDEEVADMVRQRKEDFYEKYSYLKPTNGLERIYNCWGKLCDGCAKASEWCRENWKSIFEIAKTIIVTACIIALCILTFNGLFVFITLGVGAIVGVVSQLIGDTISWAITGDWDGNWQSYAGAALGGAIGGCVLMLTKSPVIASAFEAAITTSFGENLENIAGGTKRSISEIRYHTLSNIGLAAFFSIVFKSITQYLSKNLAKSFPSLRRLAGSGSYDASYRMVLTKISLGQYKNFSYKTIRNGVVSGLQGGILSNIANGIIDAIKEIFKEWENTLPVKR